MQLASINRRLAFIGLIAALTGCESRWLNSIESATKAFYACERLALYPNSCQDELNASIEADLQAQKRGIAKEKIQAASDLGRMSANPERTPSPYSKIKYTLEQHPLNLSYSPENSAPFDKRLCNNIKVGQFFKVESTIKHSHKHYYAVRSIEGCQNLMTPSTESFSETILTKGQVATLDKSSGESSNNTSAHRNIILVEGNEDAEIKLQHHVAAVKAAEQAEIESFKKQLDAKMAEISEQNRLSIENMKENQQRLFKPMTPDKDSEQEARDARLKNTLDNLPRGN